MFLVPSRYSCQRCVRSAGISDPSERTSVLAFLHDLNGSNIIRHPPRLEINSAIQVVPLLPLPARRTVLR